jgi:hypothetical protein
VQRLSVVRVRFAMTNTMKLIQTSLPDASDQMSMYKARRAIISCLVVPAVDVMREFATLFRVRRLSALPRT